MATMLSRRARLILSARAMSTEVWVIPLISGITQTAVLMARAERINLARLDSMVAMTQSTSPQVLMYVSIDAARQQMATRGAELWRGAIEQAGWARDELNRLPGVRCLGEEALSRQGVASFDPTRLTISSCDLGHQHLEVGVRVAVGHVEHDVERL